MRKISPVGLELIKKHEGLRLKSYLCPAGINTIGYGTIIYPNGKPVNPGDTLKSEAEATLLLVDTLHQYEYVVNKNLSNLNQWQFDSLVSFAYNIGVSAFEKSTLLMLAKINKNDPRLINEFLRWKYASGKILAGLTARRTEEANLYFMKTV